MRTLRYLVLALIFLLLIVVVIGLFLPSKVKMERSIEINRDAATIFQVVNSLGNFNKWSPWFGKDTNAQYTLSGSSAGVGSKLAWQGNKNVGTGSIEIINSELNQLVKMQMFFGKDDQPAYATTSLKPNEESTRVSWAFENDFGYNVFFRYFGLVLEDMIAPDYEKGLKNLKTYVESLPLYDYSEISVITTSPDKVYTLESNVTLKQDIATVIGTAYAKIMAFIAANNIHITGSPKIITLEYLADVFHFKAAIPVNNNEAIDENQQIMAEQMYEGKAVKIIHKGPYQNFKQSYDVLFSYIDQMHLEKNGNPWEDFVTDPDKVTEENLITHIYQPVK